MQIHRRYKQVHLVNYVKFLLQGIEDLENDATVGFEIITTDDIDEIGTSGIIKLIRERVGKEPVYLRYSCTTIIRASHPLISNVDRFQFGH